MVEKASCCGLISLPVSLLQKWSRWIFLSATWKQLHLFENRPVQLVFIPMTKTFSFSVSLSSYMWTECIVCSRKLTPKSLNSCPNGAVWFRQNPAEARPQLQSNSLFKLQTFPHLWDNYPHYSIDQVVPENPFNVLLSLCSEQLRSSRVVKGEGLFLKTEIHLHAGFPADPQKQSLTTCQVVEQTSQTLQRFAIASLVLLTNSFIRQSDRN